MEAVCLEQTVTDDYSLWNGDTCEVTPSLPDESVGFTIFSPPFASLYTYSDSERDMGNCANDAEFWGHFDFLIPHLHRVTKPGRLCSVHCMNLPCTIQSQGHIGLRDFRGDLIRHFCGNEAADMALAMFHLEQRLKRASADGNLSRVESIDAALIEIRRELRECPPREGGWIYHSEVCIWKDPVTAMQRTKALGLLHKQLVKDSCMSRQGIPDYLVTFRKPGQNAEPVAGELDYFCGDQSTFKSNGKLSIDIWQRYASPVWMDINQSRTLNREGARDEQDERHICPLQLDVIERAMQLWSNEGDVVLSPFAGIGSEGYVALKMGRKFVGVELKESYYRKAVENLNAALESRRQKSLF